MMRPEVVFNVRGKFQWVVYLRVADNISGPLPSRLCGVNQPVIRLRSKFSVSLPALFPCLAIPPSCLGSPAFFALSLRVLGIGATVAPERGGPS
jgi:hypothetical protein